MDEENTTAEEEFEETSQIASESIESTSEQSSINDILQNLTIPLSVELCKTHISISDVGEMKSGYIIELHKSPGDSVDLIVGGKKIGEGQLVNIEGELGVRITFMVSK